MFKNSVTLSSHWHQHSLACDSFAPPLWGFLVLKGVRLSRPNIIVLRCKHYKVILAFVFIKLLNICEGSLPWHLPKCLQPVHWFDILSISYRTCFLKLLNKSVIARFVRNTHTVPANLTSNTSWHKERILSWTKVLFKN